MCVYEAVEKVESVQCLLCRNDDLTTHVKAQGGGSLIITTGGLQAQSKTLPQKIR